MCARTAPNVTSTHQRHPFYRAETSPVTAGYRGPRSSAGLPYPPPHRAPMPCAGTPGHQPSSGPQSVREDHPSGPLPPACRFWASWRGVLVTAPGRLVHRREKSDPPRVPLRQLMGLWLVGRGLRRRAALTAELATLESRAAVQHKTRSGGEYLPGSTSRHLNYANLAGSHPQTAAATKRSPCDPREKLARCTAFGTAPPRNFAEWKESFNLPARHLKRAVSLEILVIRHWYLCYIRY